MPNGIKAPWNIKNILLQKPIFKGFVVSSPEEIGVITAGLFFQKQTEISKYLLCIDSSV